MSAALTIVAACVIASIAVVVVAVLVGDWRWQRQHGPHRRGGMIAPESSRRASTLDPLPERRPVAPAPGARREDLSDRRAA